MPTMPTTGISGKPPTFHPHTKQFRPTTSPVMQPSSTPAMFRDDREHKKAHSSPDDVSSESDLSNNKDLNITPDMASKILKLIEAKSQSYEKAHKAAANAVANSIPPASTTKLKHLLEEKLPEMTSSLLTKDEENVELPSKHNHQAKATSIATQQQHHLNRDENDNIEYPSPKLPSSSSATLITQNPHQVDIMESVSKKLPLIPQAPLNQQREIVQSKNIAVPVPSTAANGAVVAEQPVRPIQPINGFTQGVGQKAPIPASSQVLRLFIITFFSLEWSILLRY